MSEENPGFRPIADSGKRPGGWVTLAFVALIMLMTGLASDIWRFLAARFDCGIMFSGLPDFFYEVTYSHGYQAGLLAGGLLGWRCGFRLTLGAALVAQGLILLGSQIFDLFHWGCPLRALFGLSAGLVLPACFQALADCCRPGQRPLPLFLLLFLLPGASTLIGSLLQFYLAGPPASIVYVLTGALLISLAWMARLKNRQWLEFRASGGSETLSPDSEFGARTRTLKIDRISKLLILAGLCVFSASGIFPTYIYEFYGIAALEAIAMEAYTPLINGIEMGRMLFIPMAVYVHIRGPRSAWFLFIGAALGLVGLFPLIGLLHSSTWLGVAGLGIGFCTYLTMYCYFLLLLNQVDSAQAGLAAAVSFLLSDFVPSYLALIFQEYGPAFGLWWLVAMSWFALGGALLVVWAKVEVDRAGLNSSPAA